MSNAPDRVAELERRMAALESQVSETDATGTTTRRKYLSAVGLAGAGLLAGSGSATAESGDDPAAAAPPTPSDDPHATVLQGAPIEHGGWMQHGVRGGLSNHIRRALDNGQTHTTIRGAWNWGEDLALSSSRYAPQGVYLDARGAWIEYDRNGWVIDNDNTDDPTAANKGAGFHLYGGFWLSTGDPDGFVRLVDTGGARLYPYQTREFRGGADGSVIYQLEATAGDWCESNKLGGRHHLADVGIRSKAGPNQSMQDNLVDSIHLSEFQDTAFDISGNWIDCTFLNPTTIANKDHCTFLRQNGTMSGTEIVAPEFEDSGQGLSPLYFCKLGPQAGRGPMVRGGEMGFKHNDITLFQTAVCGWDNHSAGNWTFNLQRPRGPHWVQEHYTTNGATRLLMNAMKVYRENAAFEVGKWDPEWVLGASL